MQKNKFFWEEQAKKFSSEIKAVNYDFQAEKLEYDTILKNFTPEQKILDLGCGNGLLTCFLAENFKESTIIGIDFIPEMIESAKRIKEQKNLENIEFVCMNAVDETLPTKIKDKFDAIITKRLLINLEGELKIKAVKNIYELLRDNGKYYMMECFLEPLKKINTIRKSIGLSIINLHEFNEYLDKSFQDSTLNYVFEIEKTIDFLSAYYLISRVFNAYLTKGKPKYDSEINNLVVDLCKKGYIKMEDYSPEKLIVFKKRAKRKNEF